jgi:hypothetical protein
MSNIKKNNRNSNYRDLEHYNIERCTESNYLAFPNTLSRPWKEENENFSLSAAIRPPYSRSYYDPNYKQLLVPGVN